jgi:aspartate/methionine/tyrosine aminotransferase
MHTTHKDPRGYFRLRPVRAAKVSEISETTAASPVPVEERVNFHIGNPVQDERLASAFLRIALGLPSQGPDLDGTSLDRYLETLDWPSTDLPKLEFLAALIRKSAPYMPRGGFQRSNPSQLVKLFSGWLTQGQADPLSYDLGEKSGIREVILASGGVSEALRVFFRALQAYLVELPARVYVWAQDLPVHLRSLPEFHFLDLPPEEGRAFASLAESLQLNPAFPSFLVLGTIPREDVRRTLRQLTLDYPLIVVEANNAPNHLSLAREAKMMGRVLRFMTPGIFSPRLKEFSTVFVAGNHEFINILEVAHFQLKGTPSASDAELLTFLLSDGSSPAPEVSPHARREDSNENDAVPEPEAEPFLSHANAVARRLDSLLASRASLLQPLLERHAAREEALVHRSQNVFARFVPGYDVLAGREYRELFEELVARSHDRSWREELTTAFLTQFLKHHPEYSFPHCVAVSGSSRTALGLLGFHCGIEEVIVPDLSWTYEHCFPKVTSVPLTPEYALDVERIIDTVQGKIAANPGWNASGAVALNNPHNATGQAFNDRDIQRLLHWLLEHRIFVIDDLAYQNVAAASVLQGPLTLRQTADELIRSGHLTKDQGEYLITVHSVSKTDCLAGSRLAVVEIRNQELLERFTLVNSTIVPNVAAIFLSYLFYRGSPEDVRAYWRLRNVIFDERMRALEDAVSNLPTARNRYGIDIRRPTGSMYPLMVISRLPAGLSLDWLSTGLARLGIGLLPLSAFARTEEGFETGRKTFRLTLGGTDSAERLLPKARRVLIDLNRMIAEEEAQYNRRTFSPRPGSRGSLADDGDAHQRWDAFSVQVREECRKIAHAHPARARLLPSAGSDHNAFLDRYLSERLSIFRRRFLDRHSCTNDLLAFARADGGNELIRLLEKQLYKDTLPERQRRFRQRPYDRTVHPTQMFSLKAEILWESALDALLRGEEVDRRFLRRIAMGTLQEYGGLNVAIASEDEGDELLRDLDSMIGAEEYVRLHTDSALEPFLSYWGDWDGSTRPSGQGHRLVASVLLANVERLAHFLFMLKTADRSAPVDPALLHDLEKLPLRNSRFRKLLDEITLLTQQLERRYKGILPFHVTPSRMRSIGMRLHIARDPLTSLWQHNDRLERKMRSLRQERKSALQYYFNLNKRLRKTLYGLLPTVRANLKHTGLATSAALYRDLLQRVVITPRIHQKLITTQDPFAIDTTVHNIMEINEISGASGNPGMILALQISMSTEPGALIALDRKTRAQREEVLRRHDEADLPGVWLIPLFEDLQAVRDIPRYLDKLWEHAVQSRRLNQETGQRFTEIIPEVFIAGSDLSQQVGQTAGAVMFREAKFQITRWLADRGLVGEVRVKMGSGEPMQRQGGYYAPASGQPAFLPSRENEARLAAYVRRSTQRSTRYATTPLMGVLAGGDLRTFQSNISEQVRSLSAEEYARLLYHVQEAQRSHQRELSRAAEPFVETRLQFGARGQQELERLTFGRRDPLFEDFVQTATENFRAIVYGRSEDVVGIHIISYFIARTTPPLRDRPTFRPGKSVAESRGEQILERIAQTIPLAKHGSLLRAIAHNQAQTGVLGINQLTTGLFRALDTFAQKQFVEGKGTHLLADRVLPHLPVYDMLHTLRLYQDVELTYLRRMERAFPPGNSAFAVLREDLDSMQQYLGPLQRELLRRHGIAVGDFFEGDRFIPDLLPTLRPDLAVLLQPDLFNRSFETLESMIRGKLDRRWATEVQELLRVPEEIGTWRARAWELLDRPVYGRLASFVELAIALSSLPGHVLEGEKEIPALLARKLRGRPGMQELFTGSQDDSMRDFLAAAFEYLSGLSQDRIEVPTTVVKALKEIERIIKIEEQALSSREQDLLRFHLLQIARLAGENG